MFDVFRTFKSQLCVSSCSSGWMFDRHCVEWCLTWFTENVSGENSFLTSALLRERDLWHHKYDVRSLILEASADVWKLASDFVCSETSRWRSDIVLMNLRQRVRSVLSCSSRVAGSSAVVLTGISSCVTCRGNYFSLPPTYMSVPGLKTPSSLLHMSVTLLSSASYVWNNVGRLA